MPYKDLHVKPFDSGTLAKLEIFEDYAQAWIPTFVMRGDPELHIFDFFSGPGYDENNVPGSPIRILMKIDEQLGNILKKKTKVTVHLNEFEPQKRVQGKFELLKKNCEEFIADHPKFKYFLTVNYNNKDASELFFELLPSIKKYPALVYLDQNGVRFISKEYLEKLETLKETDFLFFVSSSYFKRLGQTKEFKRVLDFEQKELDNAKYSNIHRLVIGKVKANLSANSALKLFPYSIKKGANIYGIIFGASHYRAVDKFLSISWNKSAQNGEADFDIDEDSAKIQLDIFGGKKLTKIEKFKADLKQKVMSGEIRDNEEALIFTYESGNFYRHANDALREMKRAREIQYNGGTPGISYDNALNWKKKKLITYNKP